MVLINISWISNPEALNVNPNCLKCTPGKNLSPANTNLLTISFTYTLKTKEELIKECDGFKGVFIPKLINNRLATCFLINILLSHMDILIKG